MSKAVMGKAVSGTFCKIGNDEYYAIESYDELPPFFMTIVSSSDHWLFVSSTGGVTAGRVNADYALFPYETVDKIHDAPAHTGPVSLFRVAGEPAHLWRPFTAQPEIGIDRNLYKHVLGCALQFEEVNRDLGLCFRYTWETSERYGLVRRATLLNVGKATVEVEVLDGFRNVLPTGIPLVLQESRSSLADAYKTSSVDAETGLGIFAMTAAISDKAEPQESLKCATIWSRGFAEAAITLDAGAIGAFERGESIAAEHAVKGRRGAFLISGKLSLSPGASRSWILVSDVNQGYLEVGELRQELTANPDLIAAVASDVRAGQRELLRLIGMSDGLQVGADRKTTAHHIANVLFNDMRGGVFADSYQIERDDFMRFVDERQHALRQRHAALLQGLPASSDVKTLEAACARSQDADLKRLAFEYLPLTFSRRHGDPSRPWNRFNIRVRGKDGERLLSYEGNWRDIFQNWEALCFSYPRFLPSVIAKFVNASTIDGYNPYRITRAGLDWEVPDPHDPWAHIGYWGDHQIVYLLRLLEWCDRFSPGQLTELLADECFAYADIPYRIKPYAELLKDARDTIVFDRAHHDASRKREAEIGTDGRLLSDHDGRVLHVNLAEKLTVPMLSKLSNFVLGGGIWLNTQRPEWNDANNALVGYAASMVTLYHLRRYQTFCIQLFGALGDKKLRVSNEVATWLEEIDRAYSGSVALLSQPTTDDAARKRLLDAIGGAFEKYRTAVYNRGFSGKREISPSSLIAFCKLSLRFIDHSIAAARRDDGLFDAYNLLEIDEHEIRVKRLYEMLEGQAAALSSGVVNGKELLGVLDRMETGPMYRKDQKSYLLYPDRGLPSYFERNRIPEELMTKNPLLQALVSAGDTSVVARDASGAYRFNSDFGNAKSLKRALGTLRENPAFAALVENYERQTLATYETVFHHAAFTGRSGSMYGYEGLGCIYWHMVAKLLLAVEEVALKESAPSLRGPLADAYYRVREGLCFNKTPAEYGAFPMDPYSHTPPFAGAQQPGMTGQVKEVVLTRFGELGVHIAGGQIHFNPLLLRAAEFLKQPAAFEYVALDGSFRSIDLGPGELGFTYCQVPIIYRLAEQPKLVLHRDSGAEHLSTTTTLSPEHSLEVFGRQGTIARIVVDVVARDLL